MRHFYIVIPVHNRVSLTAKCIDSLQEQTDRGFTVIVVDDGSTDGTEDILRRAYPNVILLKGDGNLWWSGGVNKGIRHALSLAGEDDYIITVNNDTVYQPDFVEKCRRATEQLPGAMLGSVLADKKGKIWHGGTIINWYTAKYRNVNRLKSIEDFPAGHYEPVSVLVGRGMISPKWVFEKVGLYDEEHLKQGGADADLPRRAHLQGVPLYVHYDLVTYDTCDDFNNINNRTKYHLSEIGRYFFDIKSNAHLETRFWFAHNTAANPLQGLSFLMFDLARISGHFLTNVRRV